MRVTKTNILLSLFIIVGISAAVAVASSTDSISGWAQSTNIGWIKLNNCTDPTNANTCGATAFGLSAPTSGTSVPTSGTSVPITGYAWSSNIGWVNFADSTCPTAGCVPGSKINWTTNKISGWARACSVYAAGCSGTLATNNGGWDGYIALNASNGGGSNWGLTVSTTGAISGNAWGSDVLGWVAFDGQVALPTQYCPDGSVVPADGICPETSCINGTLVNNICNCGRGTTLQNGQCLPPNSCQNGVLVSGQCVCLTGYTPSLGGSCVPITCPTGQTLQGNTCQCNNGGTTLNNCTLPQCPIASQTHDTAGTCCDATKQVNGICPITKKHPTYIES